MFGLEMVIRLSSSGNPRDQADNFATSLVENIDHNRYQMLSTDAHGQLTFPSLIPGAIYRVMAAERGWVMKKEFVAELARDDAGDEGEAEDDGELPGKLLADMFETPELTDEELDYVINYDIKYRLGADDSDEVDDA